MKPLVLDATLLDKRRLSSIIARLAGQSFREGASEELLLLTYEVVHILNYVRDELDEQYPENETC